jgi:hypothetical protein
MLLVSLGRVDGCWFLQIVVPAALYIRWLKNNPDKISGSGSWSSMLSRCVFGLEDGAADAESLKVANAEELAASEAESVAIKVSRLLILLHWWINQ